MKALKFLVVDDDADYRTKITSVLASLGECVACGDGNTAIDIYCRAINQNKKFDVVSLDIALPDISGTDVLARIRKVEFDLKLEKSQAAKVVMITSHADPHNVKSSILGGCDGYIVKPFDDWVLTQKLEEWDMAPKEQKEEYQLFAQSGLEKSIMQTANNLSKESLDLLKPPDIYMKLKDILDSGDDMSSAAKLLRSDIVITAKLINISNTSIYQGVKKNTSLTDALARLGLREALRQVCAICTRELYMSTEKKWVDFSNSLFKSTLTMAYLCEFLARYLNRTFDIDSYTMGLMRNVGYLYLLKYVEDYERKNPSSDQIELADIISLLDKYSGVFGSALLKKWGMPVEYQLVARYCSVKTPFKDNTRELDLVSLGVDIDGLEKDKNAEETIQVILHKYTQTFSNLELQGIMRLKDKVKEAVKETEAAIS